ncbi:fatty acid synthase [Megalopta genalis]|uniref:fatty acid synthase n=1 Tax=Megalopta genalis TaxID=115081 RepID=UPI003FD5544D
MEKDLKTAGCDLAELRRSLGTEKTDNASKTEGPSKDPPKEFSSMFEFKFHKRHTAQFEKLSKEKAELEAQLDDKKRDLQEKQKMIFKLQGKVSQLAQLEAKLEEKTKRLEAFSKERDILERELITTRSEVSGIKRTLELERQERRDLETRALALIKDAKRKWENAEKDKVAQLNNHIEAQTVRITELCTSNNEMSSRLQRTECELETTNAELHKLRVFQMQYKESLAKTRELSRQSVQGVETKLEEIANRAHSQLAELRAKLDLEIAKNTDLETKLRNEQDSNHCRQSRLNVALELAQNELKDCQEQLRSIQATIPVRDAEIETLKKQLQERAKQLDNAMTSEQTVTTIKEQMERSKLENEQLKQQLQVMKSDLCETMMNLEQSEALAMNLEQATQDKVALQKRLQNSLEKEEEHLRKVENLEELLKRLEQSVTKLEAENARLKTKTEQTCAGVVSKTDIIKVDTHIEEQIQKLEQEIHTLKGALNAERQTTKQAQISLWKKEKELSDANLDKRIAVRESKRADEKIKLLQEEKQKLSEKLDHKIQEDEERSRKLLRELDSAKVSLNDITKESSRNKMQAESAQRALTQANQQIEELQMSSASLRRELDAARKQCRVSQDRVDSLNSENTHLSQKIAKHAEEKSELESKIHKLEQEIKGYELNTQLLKETCTVLEEQLMDYERLTSDHETRENILIQDKMKLQKDLETTEAKLREAFAAQNEERSLRLSVERNFERLESETNDIESERNSLIVQRDQYKKLVQELNSQVEQFTTKCDDLECDLSEMKRTLEVAKAESRVVKEESSQHLTRFHELKEANFALMNDLQNSVDQGQELRMRISELESILEEMRQFYQEREVKAESTRQQQTKLIDYLQFKLEECRKKKKTVCDKILGTKQKENVPPSGTGMPVGYRELENQLAKERAKVKTLTDQLLALKAMHASVSAPTSPTAPQTKSPCAIDQPNNSLSRRVSPQRMGHNIPHRFDVGLPMRAGKCSACLDSIQFGKRAAICNECQVMTHLKCAVTVPATCGLPGGFAKQFGKSWRNSEESLSSISGSVQTLAIDQPDKPDTDECVVPAKKDSHVTMEGWVKIPERSKTCWERKYLRLEDTRLCTYEHQPTAGMAPVNRLELIENEGFTVSDNVQQPDVMGTAKSDLSFIFRIESNSSTTCWPTSRLDVMALSQTDKKNWLKALKSVTSQRYSNCRKGERYSTILRLEKNQLDLNCAVALTEENILLLGAEEGLFSYCGAKSRTLTAIRGVKRVHQLTLHPHLDIALMIAGENRQLVSCSLRQLKSNAVAAECSRPAITTKPVLTGTDSCHLYQLHEDMLCAATASHVILLKWYNEEDSGEFVGVRELETHEPCSCAIFTRNVLIVGCNKFFQIDLKNYTVDEFPEEDDSSVKAALTGVAKLGIFPVCVLNVSLVPGKVELLLCYNEFGMFVNESGQRTRAVDPSWNHLPFAFAFRKPYLFIIHFSSVEIMKLTHDSYTTPTKNPERTLIELSSLRYLGVAGSKGIYLATSNSFLELLKVNGHLNLPESNGSLTSLDTLDQDDESSSEFSFTSSLMEALDGQGKKEFQKESRERLHLFDDRTSHLPRLRTDQEKKTKMSNTRDVESSCYVAPEPGEEVVITGISGRFPESNNVQELKENLMNKVDMVTDNYTRWRLDHAEIPRDGGKVADLFKFDAIFFGVHYKQAHTLDPMCRMLLEHSFEAILDAGMNPRQLRGTNTAVIIGSCISESEKTWFYEKLQANGFGITGCSRAMLANRISYFFGLHGPSYAIDTACSSSLVALDQAYRLIRTGVCDQVIVGGSNLCLHPYVSLQFSRLGVLATDCRCKSFDAKANGYVRSEAVSVIFLQKAKNAKRIYASVVYTKSNCDGYKEQGITFPARDIQKMLLEDFYKECKLSPTILSYLEAHGTGTSIGDPEELNAIEQVFVKNRTTPLRIGSVKSNLGHTEPASGICSVAKIIIAMESGLIPPNMHFQSPVKGIKSFEEGMLKVVTEPTPWEGGFVGINSFGFGGANAHILLKSHNKEKVNNGAPSDDLPRLVALSGRHEEAVETLLNYVESMPVDVEFIRLLHEIHAENIAGNLFRGYTIVGSKISETPTKEIQEYSGMKKPVWFVFSGMGSQWAGMGESLMRFPTFVKAIQKCDAALKPFGMDIVDIITNKDKKTFDNIVNSFVGIAAIQIGLVDLLASIGVVPDNIIGHSVGELGCAYADGCFSAEQMVLAAYSRGLASIETKMIRGSMAAVGMGYDDIKDLCPPDIEVACHNGPDSSTISGPAESMKKFVTELQASKIFAKEVPCSNIAYHSRYIAEAGPKLLAYLKKVIPNPKPRSPKWLSTSVAQSQWSAPAAQLSSAEYHTNNLLNSVLFAETATMIPENAITIEIAPHGLLQAILKRSLDPNVINVPLTLRGHRDNAEYFLQALGKLYNAGIQLQLANIYPPVEFPVSRSTPMISPLIRWEHSTDWFVPVYSQRQKITTSERILDVFQKDENYEYIVHHVIDGRNLIPATGYLIMAWETVSQLQGKLLDEVSVVFEDVKFERATTLPKDGTVQLTVMVQRGSGKFEISEGTTTVVSGTIRTTNNPAQEMIAAELLPEIDDEEVLNNNDIYTELKLRGYDYTGIFRGLESSSIKGTKGRIKWSKNWAAYLDNMMQIKLLGLDTRALYVPTAIRKMVVDAKYHTDKVRNFGEESIDIPVYMYTEYDAIISGGVEIRGLKANAIQRRKIMADPVLEEYKFVANRDKAETNPEEMVILSSQVALESSLLTTPKIVELIDRDDNLSTEEVLTPTILKVLGDLPMIRPKMMLAATSGRYENLSDLDKITVVEPNKLPEDGSVLMAVTYDILTEKRQHYLDQLMMSIVDDGYILTRETTINNDTYLYLREYELNVVLEKSYKGQTLLLLKRQEKPPRNTEVVYVNNNEFSWLNKVKEVLQAQEGKKTNERDTRLVVVAEGDLENGALGMVKCLRREPCGEIVKTVIIQDLNAPKFSLDDPFYSEQINIDIGINILRPGKVWGTYRHLPLPPPKPVPLPHGFVNIKVRGDLSSLQWTEGNIKPDPSNENLVKVVYASLNFRDVMLATGKLMPEAITKSRELNECLIGFEFTGIDTNGRRVMGFAQSRSLSNLLIPLKHNMWTIPDEWSLEDAATIPSAYFTVFYAFYFFGKLKKGEKILIHAGSGAVGQAAINVALSEDCEVFTTVGTPEKRRFIRETFPSIADDHIGNSRDVSFEQMIMKQTHGEGVDIVLNSLAEDKLQASVRCLKYRGRFLEIGKFDMAANNTLGLEIFLKEISFHGVMMDTMISGLHPDIQSQIHEFIDLKLKSKCIKPLVRKCFEKHEVEAAFKYMASAKHIGKILIRVRDEKEPLTMPVLGYPRFHAAPDKSYVIVGGLGGLGLEMADWLVIRGAKNLVIVSRNGIKTGYQRMRTDIWKSYGVKVLIISGVDASKREDCEFILRSAEKQAPVDGVFNLAALLKDSLCIYQTEESFEESMKSKAGITKQLDLLTRTICPKLRHFVVFSSISCGRGNSGQTNYGMGNSVLERICERRVEEGLPGMAIEWGAVGEVGLVAKLLEDKKELVVGGTLQQRISSCLEELDKFLCQNRPIVASMLVAEKRPSASEASTVLEAVMYIMSIKDLKNVSQSASLADLGMDSMMAVEIKQTLERDFEVFLTAQDIRVLNVAKLVEMSAKDSKKQTKQVTKATTKTEQLVGMQLLMRTMNVAILSTNYCVDLLVKHKEKQNEIFFIPGIEGSASIFTPLASELKSPACCLQMGIYDTGLTLEEMADRLLPYVLERSKQRRDFTIVGYSYGSIIAIELVRRLESRGYVGHLILLDGSPDYMKAIKLQQLFATTEETFQNNLLIGILAVTNSPSLTEFKMELNKCTTWEEKLEKLTVYTPPDVAKVYTPEAQKSIATFIYKRLQVLDEYDCNSMTPLRTPIMLLKPTLPAMQMPDEAYGLRKLTYGRVTVAEVEGNHITMLDNKRSAAVINGDPVEDEKVFKESLNLMSTDLEVQVKNVAIMRT